MDIGPAVQTLILCLSYLCFVLSDKPRKLTAVLGFPRGLIGSQEAFTELSKSPEDEGEASTVSRVNLHDGAINKTSETRKHNHTEVFGIGIFSF